MVLPRGRTRRVRQHVKVMHCPEGWYRRSGGLGRDGGVSPELCSAFWAWLNSPGGRDGYGAFHAEHPVVWVIGVSQAGRCYRYPYCDAELPDEYRLEALRAEQAAAGSQAPERHRTTPGGDEWWEWERPAYPGHAPQGRPPQVRAVPNR